MRRWCHLEKDSAPYHLELRQDLWARSPVPTMSSYGRTPFNLHTTRDSECAGKTFKYAGYLLSASFLGCLFLECIPYVYFSVSKSKSYLGTRYGVLLPSSNPLCILLWIPVVSKNLEDGRIPTHHTYPTR